MTEKDKKNKKMESTLGHKDDRDVVLDNRGYYKVGNWFVKIRRINVKEVISGWSVISQAFANMQDLNLNWKEGQTWIMLFLVAIPYVPGKFYQFLQQVMELQNTSHLTDGEFYKKENDKYSNYVRKDLKTEELIDVIKIVYNQEKDRFGELAKQVGFILKPLINMVMAEKEKKKKDLLKEAGVTGQTPST